MTILILTSYAYPHAGGVSTHIAYLTRGLIEAGDRVEVWSNGNRALHISDMGCRAIARTGDRARTLVAARDLKVFTASVASLLASDTSIGLVHAHDPVAAVAAIDASRHSPTVLLTVHGPLSYEIVASYPRSTHYAAWARAVEARAYGESHHIIAVDRGQAAIVIDDFGVPRSKVTTIRNAIDVSEISVQCARDSAPLVDNPFFVVPRRLVRKNGVEFAIRALARCSHSEAQLLIAGDGPLRSELMALARELGLASRVIFAGALGREVLLPLMAKSMGVIVPSVPVSGVVEATSLSVLEAMACKVPVVASNIGGIGDIISSTSIGLLVEPGDPDQIASKLDAVLDRGVDRNSITELAFRHVTENYDLQGWTEKVRTLYAHLRLESAATQ